MTVKYAALFALTATAAQADGLEDYNFTPYQTTVQCVRDTIIESLGGQVTETSDFADASGLLVSSGAYRVIEPENVSKTTHNEYIVNYVDTDGVREADPAVEIVTVTEISHSYAADLGPDDFPGASEGSMMFNFSTNAGIRADGELYTGDKPYIVSTFGEGDHDVEAEIIKFDEALRLCYVMS